MPSILDRSDFDIEGGLLWVMHCAEGLVPRPAAEAARRFLDKESRPWLVRWEEDFKGIPSRTRSEAARLLGAEASDITLTATTSSGLITVAQALDWREGDEVVLPLGEFPSNIWPWRALASRGVTVRQVPLWDGHAAGADAWRSSPPPTDVDPEAALVRAVGSRTRVVAASWVRFQDGLRLDLPRLAAGCRERGARLVVDGIQGAGTWPVELSGVAAFAAGGHKGLLSPQGLGVLWTDPAFRLELAPLGSWLSVEQATDFDRPSTDVERDWVAGGARLEQGVPNLVGAAALEVSLRMLANVGAVAMARHIGALEDRLLAGLGASGAWRDEARRVAGLRAGDRLASIVSLHHGERGPEGLEALLQSAAERRIHASVREGYLRVALHGWHDERDVDRLLEWLTDPPDAP